MNFLAHAWLATQAAEDAAVCGDLVVGGMIGDSVKGLLPAGLPDGLAAGVGLHRAIDAFAEADEYFQRSRLRLPAARRRVAGIVVDMAYDHFLARHWSRFETQPLAEFAQSVYALLGAHEAELPPLFLVILARMRAHDWLSSYADVTVLAAALDRMAQRLSRPELLHGSGVEVLQNYAGLEEDFLAFLPRARSAVQAARARQVAQRRGIT